MKVGGLSFTSPTNALVGPQQPKGTSLLLMSFSNSNSTRMRFLCHNIQTTEGKRMWCIQIQIHLTLIEKIYDNVSIASIGGGQKILKLSG